MFCNKVDFKSTKCNSTFSAFNKILLNEYPTWKFSYERSDDSRGIRGGILLFYLAMVEGSVRRQVCVGGGGGEE